MILYFTGTGNSKYLAGVLAKQLADEAVDVAALMKEGKHPTFTSDKPYVLVAPVYAWRLPKVFLQWVSRCKFTGNNKVYFIIDCGSEIGAAANYAKKFALKTGFEYMGTAEVVMPENYLVMFPPTPAEEDEGIIAAATEKAENLAKTIASQEPFSPIKNNFIGHFYSDFVNPFFYGFYIGAKKFYASDACISCGKCVENCMLNNISLKDGKPVWGKDCTHCMACICKCPPKAIEYGKNTKDRRRYICPKE